MQIYFLSISVYNIFIYWQRYDYLPTFNTKRLWAIILMFNYSEPFMIMFSCSNYYNLKLIIIKYI